MMPPSIVLIVYGLTATGTSIGALFIAAVIPAVLLCSLYVVYVVARVHLESRSLAPATLSDRREFALPMRRNA